MSQRDYRPRSTIASQNEYDDDHEFRHAPGRRTLTSKLWRKASNAEDAGPDAWSAVRTADGSSGQPLPAELRERFEQSTGFDLGGVRVHTGSSSARAASAVGARAYALGRSVHFGEGEYQPATRSGQELIAHEVFHTVQAPESCGDLQISDATEHAEVEADTAAAKMVDGKATAAPRKASSGVVHRQKKNSYSAQEGLTWEGGTELTEDEHKQWASQKATLVSAANGFLQTTTGLSVNTGADDLVKKLKKQAAYDLDKQVETLGSEVSGTESQMDMWDEKRTAGTFWGAWGNTVTDTNADKNYHHWKKLHNDAENDLEKLEDSRTTKLNRAAQQATKIVGAINSFVSTATSVGSAVGAEAGKTAPSQFSSITDMTGKIGKITQAISIGAQLMDRTAIDNFKANPNLETATAWANQLGNTFESLSGLASGLPGGWGTVISKMMSMPKIVTGQFLSVMKARYDRIDAETTDNHGGSKLLEEGTSG